MIVNRSRATGKPSSGGDTFTGLALIDPVHANPDGNIRVSNVFFEPMARTHWHRHSGDQILLVSGGRGYVGTRDGRTEITAGDVVYFAPGEEHWHAGGEDTFMHHLAIGQGTTEFLGEVTLDEYSCDACTPTTQENQK